MASGPADRRLPPDELERMVGLVRSDWHVREAAPADAGVTPVYHLRVTGPGGERSLVLKAARADDGHPAVGDGSAEARLLAILAEHTAIPVPEVVGLVDDHEGVRTPFFLMATMDGDHVPPEDVATWPDATLRRLARQSGRYLAQLHAVGFDRVTSFGRGVHSEPDQACSGGRPSGDPAGLVLADGYDDFRDQLRDWWADDFGSGFADGRFADLAPAIQASLRAGLDGLGPYGDPTLARLDHGFHNLLVEPETGRIDGVLDWGNLAAFPPAYDLALVEIRLSGGPRLALPEVPDRRATVRDAMLDGYRHERPLPPTDRAQRECFQLDVFQSWMQTLDRDPSALGIPADRVEDAAAGFRSLVAPLVD